MAQYWIKHSCGHMEHHQLYGPWSERDRREEWLKTQPCQECKHEAESQAAQDFAREQGLPALTGSPKQIAWAERIRKEQIGKVETEAAKYRGMIVKLQALRELREAETQAIAAFEAAVAAVRAEASAAWWIDHRHDLGSELIRAKAVK
jgi:hypothetical protein